MQPTALEKPQTLSMCEHFFGFKKSSVVNSKFLFVRHCDKFRTAAVYFEKFCFVNAQNCKTVSEYSIRT